MTLYILLQQCNVSIYYVYFCITHEYITPNDIRGLSLFSTCFIIFPGLSISTRGLAGLSENLLSP
jgi:hypothetical protein